MQEMENVWNEYSSLERDVDWLRTALEGQMNRSGLSQVRTAPQPHHCKHIQIPRGMGTTSVVFVFMFVCVFVYEQKEKSQIKRELWRIEDVIAGLSSSKANYQVTISSVTNPGERSAVALPPLASTNTHWSSGRGRERNGRYLSCAYIFTGDKMDELIMVCMCIWLLWVECCYLV